MKKKVFYIYIYREKEITKRPRFTTFFSFDFSGGIPLNYMEGGLLTSYKRYKNIFDCDFKNIIPSLFRIANIFKATDTLENTF